MFLNGVTVLIFVCNFVVESRALEELTPEGENIILRTESILRNATNKLFLDLGFNKRGNQMIKKALSVHNFFTAITLKDHHTLNYIFQTSRVNKHKWSSESVTCLEILNELLNEDWNGSDVDSFLNNEAIIDYIDDFPYKLVEFKEKSNFSGESGKLDIIDELIHILKSENPSQFNPARRYNATVLDDDASLSDGQLWAPQPSRRIFRGSRTDVHRFPFVASVLIYGHFHCTGSIITSDLVLTAASCLYHLPWNSTFFSDHPGTLSVRVGSNYYIVEGIEVPVVDVYLYPHYVPSLNKHNLAILRLQRRLDFTKPNKKVNMIAVDDFHSRIPARIQTVTIVGWGATEPNNIITDPRRNHLSYTDLTIMHLQECQNFYTSYFVTYVNFCGALFKQGSGACNHDVGSPGVVEGVLTGVVSFGSAVCGAPGYPTVFTKIGYYSSWIRMIKDQNVSDKYKTTTRKVPTLPHAPLLPYTYFQILPNQSTTRYYNITPPLLGRTPRPLLKKNNLFRDLLSQMFNSKETKIFNVLRSMTPSDIPIQEHTQKTYTEEVDNNNIDGNEIKTLLEVDLDVVTEKVKNNNEQESISKINDNIEMNDSRETSGRSDDSTEPEAVKADYLAIEEDRTASKQEIGVTQLHSS